MVFYSIIPKIHMWRVQLSIFLKKNFQKNFWPLWPRTQGSKIVKIFKKFQFSRGSQFERHQSSSQMLLYLKHISVVLLVYTNSTDEKWWRKIWQGCEIPKNGKFDHFQSALVVGAINENDPNNFYGLVLCVYK